MHPQLLEADELFENSCGRCDLHFYFIFDTCTCFKQSNPGTYSFNNSYPRRPVRPEFCAIENFHFVLVASAIVFLQLITAYYCSMGKVVDFNMTYCYIANTFFIKGVFTMSGIDKFKHMFLEKYTHYVDFTTTKEFIILYDFLYVNKQKLIWAIEELDSPPIEGVAKSILQLGIDFTVPQTRKITGAMIAVILSDEYIPVSSGRRVSCKPFITSSMYEKKVK